MTVLGAGWIRFELDWKPATWSIANSMLWVRLEDTWHPMQGFKADSVPAAISVLSNADWAKLEEVLDTDGQFLKEVDGYPFSDWALECMQESNEQGYVSWVERVASDSCRAAEAVSKLPTT